MTSQPDYKCVGHIGDVDPIAHGGGFVYVDQTGVHDPMLTYFEPGSDEEWHKTEGKTPLKVYRFDLDPPRFKTNGPQPTYDREKFGRPEDRGTAWVWHKEWYVDDLDSIAASCGTTKFAMLRGLLSKDPMRRALAYQDIIGHWGVHQFDEYPLDMTEDEAYERYAEEMKLSLGR